MRRLKQILVILFDNGMADKRATKMFLINKIEENNFLC